MVDTRGHGGVVVGITAFLAALATLVGLFLSGRLGLIHLNVSVRGSTIRKCVVAALASLVRVPILVHLHSGRFPEFYRGLPGPLRATVRWLFSRAEKVVVLGQVWEDFIATELGVPRTRILILPNAVAAPPPVHTAPRETCHIVMLGRLGVPKGTPELMEALASSRLRDLPWRATLAGDGLATPYQAAAAASGLAHRVDFPGWLDSPAVASLLADADILVLPSHSENLPVAVIEALAHGLAVVTTPVGATPELVQDGESALFVPVQDAEALADAIARLVEDPELRARIGAAGHAVFRAELDIDERARTLADLYVTILHRQLVPVQ